MKAIVTAGVMAAALTLAGAGQAQAHNLLLVAGNPQIVMVKVSDGNVIVTKVLAAKDAGELDKIVPAAGGHK